MKFHENPSSRSQVVHADGQTDRQEKTKLITTFHNSVNTLK